MAAHVRNARIDDIPDLQQVEYDSGLLFLEVPGLEWIADASEVLSTRRLTELIALSMSWVATDANSHVEGFLCAEAFGDDLHIWQLSVCRASQRRGIGSALMERAEASAAEAGLSALTLTTFRDIPWNEPFYLKLGYETLNADRLAARLHNVLLSEIRHNMPGERRCAMMKPLHGRKT